MPSPLIEQLTSQHGYPLLTQDNMDEALAQEETLVLFFSEDPKRYPEALDVAVVLPELVNTFAGQFKAMVVERGFDTELKDRYDINVWPCLVFLRNGRYLGKISKIQDWHDYMEMIPEILEREARRNPGVGIPLVEEKRSENHA